ncbi:lysosomal aspartic protease-like [Amblyomma americanum]
MRFLACVLVLGAVGCCLGQSNGASQIGAQHGEIAKSISVPISNHKNGTHTIQLKIGTPPQEFTVLIDTVGPTWLTAYNCTPTEPCSGRKKFSGINSASYGSEQKDEMAVFFSGNVTGPLSRDVHQLGGVDIGQHSFINAETLNGVPSYQEYPFDGILGLRLGPHSLLREMARTGVITKPSVGLYFSSDENVTGEALFGGANENHYQGSLSFLDAESDRFQFRITRYDYDGMDRIFPREGDESTAILAPFDPFIRAPWNEIHPLNEWLGAMFKRNGRYEFHCSSTPADVIFTIASKQFVLRAEDYIMKVNTSDGIKCYSAFVTSKGYRRGDPSWQLGLPFLRRAYTVLEASLQNPARGRVGFAHVRGDGGIAA